MAAQPRPYQIELLNEAQRSNIIAFLDTGSGKTLISILLMEQMAAKLVPIDRDEVAKKLSDKIDSEGLLALKEETGSEDQRPEDFTVISGIRLPRQPKKIIFCVPTVSLVTQQAEKIRQATELVVGEYSREDSASVSYWDALGWAVEMSHKQVLVFTPQIFLNTLRHGFMSLQDNVSLLIFDECHHAWKNHPYALIMSEFYHSIPPGSPKPKVLGMTASPIYQKTLTRDVAVSQLVELQKCLDCRIVTVKERGMLDGFVSKAKEYLIEYNPVAEGMVYDKAISKNDADDLDWMEELTLSSSGKLFAYYVYVLNRIQALEASLKESVGRCLTLVKELEIDLGVWCAGRVAMRLFNSICYNRKRAQTDDVKADSAISEVPPFTFPDPPSIPSLETLSYKDITPKVWTLIDIISSRYNSKSSPTHSLKHFRGMVFVEKRTTANILCELLMQLSSVHFPGLSCGFVTGQGSSSNAPDKMKSTVQQRVLDRFRSGETQLMVVTRVAEEGIDIPACKLIVIFDLFRSNTGYVQSRGRARDLEGSEYILLVKRNDTHALDVISQAKVAEMMTRSIVSSSLPELSTTAPSAIVTKGDTDNAIIEELVGNKDLYSTPVTTVSPSGFDSVLSRFLKRKVVYKVVLEGSKESDPIAWENYFAMKSKQPQLTSTNSPPSDPSSTSLSGFAYSIQISEDPSNATSTILGAIRFTRKSAMQSAALESIRYLHTIGSLNDHLLPTTSRSKQKGSAFSFAREILEIKRRRLQLQKKDRKNVEQLVYDAANGEGKEDAAYTYCQKTPSCLSSRTWESIPSSVSQFVELYVTRLSFGTQLETYTRGCDPPIPQTSKLFSTVVEPRRSFAILTASPIPADEIPDFPIFLESRPWTVTVQTWTDTSKVESDCPEPIRISISDYEKLKAFQTKLWNLVLPRKLSQDAPGAKNTPFGDVSTYLLAPMLGLPTTETDFKWSMDLKLLSRVVNDDHISLYDFVTVVEKRIKSLSLVGGEEVVKKRRLTEDTSLTIVDVASAEKNVIPVGQMLSEEATALGPMDLNDPVYNMSDSDDDSIEDSDSKQPKAQFSDVLQSLGISSLRNRRVKRKRDQFLVEDLAELHSAWDCIDASSEVGSFEHVFSLIQKLSEIRKVPTSGLGQSVNSDVKDLLNSILRQALIQTPHNKKVYSIEQLALHMNINSPFETDKFADVTCFGDYFEKLGYTLTHSETPLIEVRNIPGLRNFSRPFRRGEHSETEVTKYLALDVGIVLPIPLELVKLAQIIPSVLYRIEGFCLMHETRISLNQPQITMDTMREVFTASSALESYSYERLEILGDAFLKLASSADLFHRYPNANEGDLSKMRSSVVSNQNLFNVAKRFDFGGLMVVAPFKPKLWSPPRLFLSGDTQPLEIQRKFSEKRLADFVEAFIGASFVNGGVESSINLLHTFGLVNETALTILGTKDLKSDWSLDESAAFAPTITFSNDGFNLEKLESRIGYKFRNEKLASQAMTHQSYSLNLPSYEALEFLGDAVLDWIVMQYLFHTYSTLSPDKLTDLRQAAVNNESFCRLAVSIGLQEHLRHSVPSLTTQLTTYLAHLSTPGVLDMDPVDVTQEGPKVLGDLFEALVGAIYVDSGYSLATVWQVMKPVLSGFWLRFVNPLVVSKSPVRQMHEHLQSIGFETDEVWYQFSEIDSVFCCKIFLLDTNIAEDTGNSRQLSKRRACIRALKWFDTNQDDLSKLVKLSEEHPGKNWRNSLSTANSLPNRSVPKLEMQLNNINSSENIVKEGSDPQPTDLIISQETSAIDTFDLSTINPVSSFKTCLMALEMSEMEDLDRSRETASITSTAVRGDYFLMHLLAVQQQERLRLQAIQNEQLRQLLGDSYPPQ